MEANRSPNSFAAEKIYNECARNIADILRKEEALRAEAESKERAKWKEFSAKCLPLRSQWIEARRVQKQYWDKNKTTELEWWNESAKEYDDGGSTYRPAGKFYNHPDFADGTPFADARNRQVQVQSELTEGDAGLDLFRIIEGKHLLDISVWEMVFNDAKCDPDKLRQKVGNFLITGSS